LQAANKNTEQQAQNPGPYATRPLDGEGLTGRSAKQPPATMHRLIN